MTVAHARALLTGDVRIEPDEPDRQHAALDALAQWALRFTPVVAPDPPDGLRLDITGCERVFGGERALASNLLDSLHRLGLTGAVAVAPTDAAAWALARFRTRFRAPGRGHDGAPDRDPVCIVRDPADLARATDSLPVDALRLDADLIDGLRELAVDTIGQLRDLPRSSLPSRFDDAVLHRLDQLHGAAFEPLSPVRPVDPLTVRRVFNGPTRSLDGVTFTIREGLIELTDQLEQREQGAGDLRVTLVRADAPPVVIPLTLSRPTRDAKHLDRLLQPRLEHANLGFGVDAVALTVTRAESLAHTQTRADWTTAAGDPDAAPDPAVVEPAVGELVDTLANRLGADRVLRIEPRESHRPERVFEYRTLHRAAALPRPFATRLTSAPRPLHLLPKPERIDVASLAPDGPPARIIRRGETHLVRTAVGPERIGPEWWRLRPTAPDQRGLIDDDRLTRDYYRIELDAGLWAWVFRTSPLRRWFLHGWWT